MLIEIELRPVTKHTSYSNGDHVFETPFVSLSTQLSEFTLNKKKELSEYGHFYEYVKNPKCKSIAVCWMDDGSGSGWIYCEGRVYREVNASTKEDNTNGYEVVRVQPAFNKTFFEFAESLLHEVLSK